MKVELLSNRMKRKEIRRISKRQITSYVVSPIDNVGARVNLSTMDCCSI